MTTTAASPPNPSPPSSWTGDLGDLTARLGAWREGDPAATAELMRLVEPVLRRLAGRELRRTPRERSLQATELVNEAYLRLVGAENRRWEGRLHFFNFASLVMRRVLVDRERRRRRQKRDPGAGAEAPPVLTDPEHPDLLDLDRALDRLEAEDAIACRVVVLRYFGGLTVEETAEALQIGRSSVVRHWRFARSWLFHELDR